MIFFQFTRRCSFVIIFLFCFTSYSAELFSNARQYALGGAYSGIARGAEATLINPANLSLPSKSKWTMSIVGVRFDVFNNAIKKNQYDRYNGSHLKQKDIDNILKMIPQNGLSLNSSASAQGVGLSYKTFSIALSGIATAFAHFDKTLFELVFKGNETGRIYDFKPAKGNALSFSTLTIAYGHRIHVPFQNINHCGIGIALSYIKGFYYSRVIDSYLTSQTTINSANGSGYVELENAQGGNGFSVNISSTMTIFKRWRFAVVLHNIFSTILWNNRTEQQTINYIFKTTSLENFSEEISTNEIYSSETRTNAISNFYSQLPIILRLAVLRPIRHFLLSVEYEQGFSESVLSSKKPRVLFGSEYWLAKNIRLRGGLALGGRYENHLSTGFGFIWKKFCWDFAIRSFAGITGDTLKGLGVASSISMRY